MGILSRIKRRLPIIGRNSAPTPPPSRSVRPAPTPRWEEEEEEQEPLVGSESADAEGIAAAIKQEVETLPVVLYMKGTRYAPQCGFSARAVSILDGYGVEFATRNVLASPALRTGIKEFSSWPTIPQIFVGGEFIGGCDIAVEMDEKGELKEMIDEALAAARAPASAGEESPAADG